VLGRGSVILNYLIQREGWAAFFGPSEWVVPEGAEKSSVRQTQFTLYRLESGMMKLEWDSPTMIRSGFLLDPALLRKGGGYENPFFGGGLGLLGEGLISFRLGPGYFTKREENLRRHRKKGEGGTISYTLGVINPSFA